ncbi:hypothetical protein [Spirosoma radiotolerans]|uniref:Uncharacterized protein n=1 Tax=Spirosoma radiotolerans TaxID=1379870 RepID=A0A0E3ZX57_9BACT|nr:hypothetical protein [Spirosoma radiotolerans]AKD56955.1 hypothetical protein SD10_20660 [Spirosoma radiotolerans]
MFIYTHIFCWNLFFSSCKSFKTEFKQARLLKNDTLLAWTKHQFGGDGGLGAYRTIDVVKVQIKEDLEGLFLTVIDKNDIEGIQDDNPTATQSNSAKIEFLKEKKIKTPDLSGSFSETKGATIPPNFFFNTSDERVYFGFKNRTLRYRQLRPYVQAMATAFKHRGKVGNVQAQFESGLSGALAGGLKHSWNKFTGTKNALGFSTISKSLAGGVLVGLSTADINAKSTQQRVDDANATKNLTFPVGAHIVVGYNNINFGIAAGQDIIIGSNCEKWNYHGQWWWGVLVGLDIIK